MALTAIAHDGPRLARKAGLIHVLDEAPGIQRVSRGKKFVYLNGGGREVTQAASLERIRHLAIPPAWTSVWICPREKGHIQATGRDARGRKQYRYHDEWRKSQDQQKFSRLAAFGRALPAIRRKVARDISGPPGDRSTVLGTIIYLLERSYIRVGNEEYEAANGSFGLTTLKQKHLLIQRDTITFDFIGKSAQKRHVVLHDTRLAGLLQRIRRLPGPRIFQYRDSAGHVHKVRSQEVNGYLKAISGGDFTAKDFRTWGGTLLAFYILRRGPLPPSRRQREKKIVAAIKLVSGALGNTPAVCRRAYISAGLLQHYAEGKLPVISENEVTVVPSVRTIIAREEKAFAHMFRKFIGPHVSPA